MVRNKKEQLQAHGKREVFNPTTLDEIVRGEKYSIYKTQDPLEYTRYLRQLDNADLMIHARKVGLVPVNNRVQVERELLRRFKANLFSSPPKKNQSKISNQDQEELYRLLESGR